MCRTIKVAQKSTDINSYYSGILKQFSDFHKHLKLGLKTKTFVKFGQGINKGLP
jgi:hypothetical protein